MVRYLLARARQILCVAGLVMTGAQAQTPATQNWPTRPIKMLIPLAAGSANDTIARIVAEKMSETLGQPIVIENQPGASGLVGMRAGARAEPDGYTILAVNDSIMTMLPNLKSEAGYDPVADFAPVTQMATVNFGFVAHTGFAASTISELIELARKTPGVIDYASGGPGSPQHIGMELFQWKAGVKLNHTPYRGVTQAFNDVLAGHVPVMIVGFPAPIQFVASGKLKLLAVTSAQRSKLFPATPTVMEANVLDFDFSTWGGIIAPARTPSTILARLNQAAIAALRDPVVAKRVTDLGFDIIANQPAEFTASIKSGLQRYGELSRAANIKID